MAYLLYTMYSALQILAYLNLLKMVWGSYCDSLWFVGEGTEA